MADLDVSLRRPTWFGTGTGPGTGKSTLARLLRDALEAARLPVVCWYEVEVLAQRAFAPFFRAFLDGDPGMTGARLDAVDATLQRHVAPEAALVTESLPPFVRWLLLGGLDDAAILEFCAALRAMTAARGPRIVRATCPEATALGRAGAERGKRPGAGAPPPTQSIAAPRTHRSGQSPIRSAACSMRRSSSTSAATRRHAAARTSRRPCSARSISASQCPRTPLIPPSSRSRCGRGTRTSAAGAPAPRRRSPAPAAHEHVGRAVERPADAPLPALRNAVLRAEPARACQLEKSRWMLEKSRPPASSRPSAPRFLCMT